MTITKFETRSLRTNNVNANLTAVCALSIMTFYIPHTKILAIRLVEMQSHDQRYFAYHVK